jgi:hypothetical protein
VTSDSAQEKQIAGFLAKYTPEIVAYATDARKRMRKDVPGGVEFVYDNYNSLVFGYGPSGRPSEAVLSLRAPSEQSRKLLGVAGTIFLTHPAPRSTFGLPGFI